MRTLNCTFTEGEFRKLEKAKEALNYRITWERFLLMKCTNGHSVHKRLNK